MSTETKTAPRTLRQLLANYPIKDGHRKQFLKYPIQVTQEIKEKYPDEMALAKVGQFVSVKVARHGCFVVFGARPFDTFESCHRACLIHNYKLGFTSEETDAIVGYSMGIKTKQHGS